MQNGTATLTKFDKGSTGTVNVDNKFYTSEVTSKEILLSHQSVIGRDDNLKKSQNLGDFILSAPEKPLSKAELCQFSHKKSKVCIRAKWPIRPELIPVSIA